VAREKQRSLGRGRRKAEGASEHNEAFVPHRYLSDKVLRYLSIGTPTIQHVKRFSKLCFYTGVIKAMYQVCT
jgi:hypothetical protein